MLTGVDDALAARSVGPAVPVRVRRRAGRVRSQLRPRSGRSSGYTGRRRWRGPGAVVLRCACTAAADRKPVRPAARLSYRAAPGGHAPIPCGHIHCGSAGSIRSAWQSSEMSSHQPHQPGVPYRCWSSALYGRPCSQHLGQRAAAAWVNATTRRRYGSGHGDPDG